MKLYEHEAKKIFAKYRIAVPKGEVATTPTQAREIAAKLNVLAIVKAQILVAGRGKAGGILFADTPEEAELAAKKLLGAEIKGVRVPSVLIEEKISVQKELYLGITVDRAQRCYVAVASSEGGMEIEEIAAKMPEKIVKVFINPIYGFQPYHARQIARKIGYAGKQMLSLASTFFKLYKLSVDYDAELAEMNPLMEKPNQEFVAADTRLIIDDNALYRHPELKNRLAEGKTELTPQELEAQKSGLAYVKLEGNIGIIGNGAGLVMATLDTIHLYGGNPANFLDVGGGASAERVAASLNIILSDARVNAIFINVLGGITRCDETAKGILEARKQVGFA
ncbi:MAG: ADP-forming succinate--CoA ligase subunit beta, partial [Candidatus Bathyarchaeota archaeon]|nr:ADP-forming succinate--CoA ligase subunit beta [Candidatus Bathyarchaeota archaeon]